MPARLQEQVIDREQTDHTNLELEILEMRGKTHPYIVELKEALQTNSHLYLVMELVPGGSLFDLISRADKPLSESAARFYAAEILLALEELHKNHVAYRDMKLENILVDRDGTSSRKIADITIARARVRMSERERVRMRERESLD